jgi:hypothetical protein
MGAGLCGAVDYERPCGRHFSVSHGRGVCVWEAHSRRAIAVCRWTPKTRLFENDCAAHRQVTAGCCTQDAVDLQPISEQAPLAPRGPPNACGTCIYLRGKAHTYPYDYQCAAYLKDINVARYHARLCNRGSQSRHISRKCLDGCLLRPRPPPPEDNGVDSLHQAAPHALHRILLADDNGDMREYVQRLLRHRSCAHFVTQFCDECCKMHGNDRLVLDDEHAHKLSLGRSKWYYKLNRVTPGHPLSFHVGTKLRGKGVDNARPQPQAPLILRRPCPVSEMARTCRWPCRRSSQTGRLLSPLRPWAETVDRPR